MPLTAAELAQWNDSRQPMLYGVLGTLLLLSNLSMVLRVAAVLRQKGRLVLEDYLMIAAVVFSDGIIGALLSATVMGFGLHSFRVLAEDPSPPLVMIHIFEIVWVYAVLNGFCFLTIKMSILFFYRRLFFVQRWFRIAWWANVVYAVLWTLGSTLFYIFQCTPVDYYWTRLAAVVPNPNIFVDPNGQCVSSIASIGTPIMLNTVSDVVILMLPIPVLFKLKMSLAKRLRLVLLLCLGFLAAMSGFVRFAFIFQSSSASDQTYSAVEFLLWSNIEEVLGIVCANIPLIVAYLESRHRKDGSKSGTNITDRRTLNTNSHGIGHSVTVRTSHVQGPYVQLENYRGGKDLDASSIEPSPDRSRTTSPKAGIAY